MSDEHDRVDPALRDTCTRFLHWHGRRTPADLLAELPDDIVGDRYGEGGVVAALEERIAELLGMPAAVFLPSGTMAQQAALRVHADRRGRQVVAFHPTCHLELHEDKAYQRLHGLVGRPVGDPHELLTVDDLATVAEPLAALVLELPQREIGGQLPGWDDLVAQVAWARVRGAAVHLDGARLWESTPHYGRQPAEIAGLFDTVYVSFYKGLGALPGCCLAGPDDVVDEVRAWRKRLGGTLFGLWPQAASAMAALDLRLSRMPDYVEHARAVAEVLADVDGVAVTPTPPVTPMMHLSVRTSAAAFVATATRLAADEGIWTWGNSVATDVPGWRKVELVVGDATLALSAEEVGALVARFVDGAP